MNMITYSRVNNNKFIYKHKYKIDNNRQMVI